MAPALLVGARTSAELIATHDMRKLAGVVFRPGGLGPWLRERADLFYEQSQSLSDLWPVEPMRERLRDLARLRLRCRFLTKRFASKLQGESGVAMFCKRCACSDLFSVRETASTLGISERRLHTVFSEDVGLSPKQWSRVETLSACVARSAPGRRTAMGGAGSRLWIRGPVALLARFPQFLRH